MATVNASASANAADIYASIGGKSNTTSVTEGSAAGQEQKFLTLLMAQIKNQDPLNPMDNAAVTTQLAQLNTVSGIEKLNATMAQLLDGYNEAQAMQSAGMIGKNVMVAGNSLPLVSGQAVGAAQLEGAADLVTLTIKDSSGKLVQTESLGAKDAGSLYFSWDGKGADGVQLKDDNYSFAIEATMGGKSVPASAMQVGTVSAVVRSKDGFLLDLGALGDVAFKDVQQIL